MRMKKIIALLLATVMLIPLSAKAEETRDIDYNSKNIQHSFKVTRDKSYPGSWQQEERVGATVTFTPIVKKVVRSANSTKLTAEVTTTARVIMIEWYDGKRWRSKPYSNAPCTGSIIAHNDAQIKLKSDSGYSSWGEIYLTQGAKKLFSKRRSHPNGQKAAYSLCFTDEILAQIRQLKSVKRERTFNIPCRAKEIRIRSVYTGIKRDSYSDWVVIK